MAPTAAELLAQKRKSENTPPGTPPAKPNSDQNNGADAAPVIKSTAEVTAELEAVKAEIRKEELKAKLLEFDYTCAKEFDKDYVEFAKTEYIDPAMRFLTHLHKGPQKE